MRHLIVVTILGFALSSSSLLAQGARADKGALKEILVNLEKQSWEAWKNHDGKFFQDFLSDDHVELGSGGPASKAAVVNMVGGTACSVKSYAVDHFELTMLSSDTALLTYHAAQDTTCGGKPVPSPVWVSSLFVKHGDRWLNALYQHSPASK
jgi:hypothetical protein